MSNAECSATNLWGRRTRPKHTTNNTLVLTEEGLLRYDSNETPLTLKRFVNIFIYFSYYFFTRTPLIPRLPTSLASHQFAREGHSESRRGVMVSISKD